MWRGGTEGKRPETHYRGSWDTGTGERLPLHHCIFWIFAVLPPCRSWHTPYPRPSQSCAPRLTPFCHVGAVYEQQCLRSRLTALPGLSECDQKGFKRRAETICTAERQKAQPSCPGARQGSVGHEDLSAFSPFLNHCPKQTQLRMRCTTTGSCVLAY